METIKLTVNIDSTKEYTWKEVKNLVVNLPWLGSWFGRTGEAGHHSDFWFNGPPGYCMELSLQQIVNISEDLRVQVISNQVHITTYREA